MQFVTGKKFRGQLCRPDSSYVILNEAAVRRMRLKDPINQVITWNMTSHFKVIGVVRDALMQSPFDAVGPTFFFFNPDWASKVTYRLSRKTDVPTAIASLGTIFQQKYNPALSLICTGSWMESYAEKFVLEVLDRPPVGALRRVRDLHPLVWVCLAWRLIRRNSAPVRSASAKCWALPYLNCGCCCQRTLFCWC